MAEKDPKGKMGNGNGSPGNGAETSEGLREGGKVIGASNCVIF